MSLRYGWVDSVGRACATSRQVAKVLRTRGWEGVRLLCPRC
ncbi:hypothetical protein [Mariniluteicoccus flavus]